jgi:hypothetical protein
MFDTMCKPELQFLKDTVVPVLTKVKPGDEDIDLDQIRSDTDEILKEEFKSVIKHHNEPAKRDTLIKDK